MPAATALEPSLTIACASTVAVVVPSPAKSEDFEATSRTICAPMFSNLSSSSISLATVTPSLVMRGAPYDLSSTTLRPLGPSVTRTALARMSTPRNIRSRASTENLTSLAAIFITPFLFVGAGAPQGKQRQASGGFLSGRRLRNAFEHAHDVALLHDQVFDTLDLDLRARPLAEQHAVAGLQVDWDELAVLVTAAGTDRNDLALRRLLLRRIGDDDAAGGLRFGINTLDPAPILKLPEFHSPLLCPFI